MQALHGLFFVHVLAKRAVEGGARNDRAAWKSGVVVASHCMGVSPNRGLRASLVLAPVTYCEAERVALGREVGSVHDR